MKTLMYAACFVAVAGAVHAANDFMPPPGLYRVDTDKLMTSPGGTPLSVHTRENAASPATAASTAVHQAFSSTRAKAP